MESKEAKTKPLELMPRDASGWRRRSAGAKKGRTKRAWCNCGQPALEGCNWVCAECLEFGHSD